MGNVFKRTENPELRGTTYVYGDVSAWVSESCAEGDLLVVRRSPPSLENKRARQVFIFGEVPGDGKS